MATNRTSKQQLRAIAAFLKSCVNMRKNWKAWIGAVVAVFIIVPSLHRFNCVMVDYDLIGRPRKLIGLQIIETKIAGHVVDEPDGHRIAACYW
jgi:hypothetical protein